MDHNQFCLDKTKQSNSNFYYSFLFLDKAQKQAITAVYAFCREVDDIVDESNNSEVALKKIQWWQSEIENVYTGKGQHPISKAIEEALQNYTLKKTLFLDMLDGMIMDLKYNSYKTYSDLSKYCYCVASTVGLLVAEIFGYKNKDTLVYADKLGRALQLVNIIRDVGEDARRERLYLPTDDLAQFGVSVDDILSLPQTQSIKFTKLMEYQYEKAVSLYKEACSFLHKEDFKSQKVGLAMASIYFKLLEEIKKQRFPVLNNKVKLKGWMKLFIAFKTAISSNPILYR